MDKHFVLSFSVGVGSLAMLVLNLVFFNSVATLLLGTSIAFNFATMVKYYPKDFKVAMKKVFWRE
ncbi:hypothetical protein [Paenibacillus illinoisensis]|uniref:Uncharacterized protein n=1 Tax=Paenibacillus illinoisensis TaxID=59845 RepID=A0A2W0CI43_9BACL|nr:hypothetical protein [Paenibacillus illinoisensis]PYY29722.1 hypothetical protein PIL02S_01922 [Paenibacillus illinoisensis]